MYINVSARELQKKTERESGVYPEVALPSLLFDNNSTIGNSSITISVLDLVTSLVHPLKLMNETICEVNYPSLRVTCLILEPRSGAKYVGVSLSLSLFLSLSLLLSPSPSFCP